ncbi:unnamed protein product [Spirodela intermedia]|uniref:Uncharacterized protein n=1 Tax=Spirodela intermedia TaxID=51605 RepID=A0A7I8JBM9_SPIIN|nr:unnamed protein product [Spirodela intermedia]CAA6667504.1 unnamed protein product [Spirodela intermedia]
MCRSRRGKCHGLLLAPVRKEKRRRISPAFSRRLVGNGGEERRKREEKVKRRRYGEERVKEEALQILGVFQALPRLVVFDLDYTLWPFYCLLFAFLETRNNFLFQGNLVKSLHRSLRPQRLSNYSPPIFLWLELHFCLNFMMVGSIFFVLFDKVCIIHAHR